MQLPEQYGAAEELERFLGDPLNPEEALSFKRAVELDEREEYPEEACALLNRWGCNRFYVPVALGGRLTSYEEVYALVRAVSRRDMTVGITHLMTYIACCPAWVAGSPEQQRTLAGLLESGRQVAIGLHEKAHGNDLLACEVEATKVENGYRLSGEKWVIGNPQRGAALIIYARTASGGGPRGFSLFLLEKRNLAAASYSYLPKFKTHGVRGHEMGGIRFRDCFVPDEALLGGTGGGLEIALRSSQITRTLVNATCLGAADTALRATLDFALSRRLYGNTVFDIPHARSTLTDAFLDLFIGSCLAASATRALHVAPEQMSVIAAVIKYFIPTAVDQLIRNVSVVLGARNYLREGHWWGIFQKLVRDTPIASVGHYSSVINLSHLAGQLQQLSKHRAKAESLGGEERRQCLEAIFSLKEPLPVFDSSKLSLNGRGRDDILQSLELSLSTLRSLESSSKLETGVLEKIVALTGETVAATRLDEQTLADRVAQYGRSFYDSPEHFELARRYCLLHAAASCVHLWVYNRRLLGDYFARGEWLALALDKLLTNFRPRTIPLRHPYRENMARELLRLHDEDRLFSVVPLQLARTAER
jgi:alkylation response protein AidB-like acyl-CoA dehydrogenase